MKNSHPNENIIRQYLLGKLNEQKELEEELSDQMFFDDDLSQMVDSIEDEILDDYLDGALSPADTQAVKEYFLCPPERKDKLQFARVMRSYFGTNQTALAPAQTTLPPRRQIDAGSAVVLRSHARTFGEIAALFLLSISCLLYIGHVRRQLQSSSAESQENLQRLEAERQHSASLEKQLAELFPTKLILVNARPRAGSPDVGMGHLEIKPSTRIIQVEISLKQVPPPHSFDVALENPTGISPLWSKTDVPASPRVLTFDMPPQGIQPGSYSIAIKPHGQPGTQTKHYDFQVTVAR